ncbi:MAG: hypothetical protein ABI477_05615 [Chryseolinea sp.]
MDTLENRLQKRIHVSLYALLFLTALLGLSVLLEGCTDKCEITNSYVYYEPEYTTVKDIRAQVALESPKEIKSTGKIYFKDGVLFVNEPGEGIHIIDNHDPAHPVAKSFLKIPGSYDLAIKGNTLYADSFVDLVAFDVSNIDAIHEVNRLEGVFKNYSVMGYVADPNCCVITGWKERRDVQVSNSDCGSFNHANREFILYNGGIALTSDAAATFSTKTAFAPGTGSGPGVGGSLARFTLSKDHLYMIDGSDIQVVNVASQQTPAIGTRSTVGWNIETLFPHKDNLFIGSTTGMIIMDISAPDALSVVANYAHVTSCDPVVVDDDYAYVTLRSGTSCNSTANQLEIIDIKNPADPRLVTTYPMTNPHGLGIDNKTLFICDGSDGLKAFDATDIMKVSSNLLAHYQNINARDVIPLDNVLMMIGDDGIFQYDYSNKADIKLLSQITVGAN